MQKVRFSPRHPLSRTQTRRQLSTAPIYDLRKVVHMFLAFDAIARVANRLVHRDLGRG